jgi:competence protein ComEA
MAREKSSFWESFWLKNKIPVLFCLLGLFLLGVGIFSLFFSQTQEAALEIIPVEEEESGVTLFADLEGAVEKPGFYELPFGSRLNELLVRAGGLSASADREWVAKNLNLAQELEDGAKFYIPKKGEMGLEAGSVGGVKTEKVNLNQASASELDSLWGIGEARAKEIIENRPYSSIEELKTKKIIPSNVYERIKDEVSVF